jgi:hypothetical protein
MGFTFPVLLGGLALVGIPVLLHLIMRQKPKHLLFPAFRFLLERQRANQRKLRLRHLLLLALRVLLIALLCLALARPRVLSEHLNLQTDRPAAVVLVFDTSFSMGYAVGGKSRLDEAKRRAVELLDELPDGSRVALLDTAEPGGEWLPSISLARDRVNALTLRPANGPVTGRLAEAYRLFGALEREPDEAAASLTRFLYVFSDRTQECWDANRTADLAGLRDRLTVRVKAVFVDVGVDKPADLAIVGVELPRQTLTSEETAVLRATVQATGTDYDTEILCRIDGEATVERKPVKLRAGQSQVISFERRGLAMGPHQAEITLATPDALPFNNAQFATFEVRGSRKVLVLADDPAQTVIWRAALEATKAFSCAVRPTEDTRRMSPKELSPYQAVCLLDVARPNRNLWELLDNYGQGGGGVLVLPGGAEMQLDDYNSEAAQRLLPGRFTKIADAPTREGVEWSWDNAAYQHPMLKSFREWNANPETDFARFPRAAFRFWQVQPRANEGSAIVSYADPDRHPAVLERLFDRKKVRGRLLLFTTALDGRQGWNNYLESLTSFYPVLADRAARYVAGEADEGSFNYVSGQTVLVALPAAVRFPTYTLEGPGLSATESVVSRADNQAELALSQAQTPGNYVLTGGNRIRTAAFSVNIPGGECQLGRVPEKDIEALLGEGALVPVGFDGSLRDALQGHWGQPVELLPWLLVLVLLLLAIENLLANRFYRNEPSPGSAEARPGGTAHE